MLTRRMAEDLSRQIELLTAQLEEQRLQIASLSQEREDSESVPNRTVEQLAAQLEQQRLQITLLTQAQNRSDQLERKRANKLSARSVADLKEVLTK